MVRKAVYIGGGYIFGLFAASFFSFEIAVCAGIALLCAGLAYLIAVKPALVRNSAIVCAAAVGLLHYGIYMAIISSLTDSLSGEEITAVLTVDEIGSKSGDSRVYTAYGRVNGSSKLKFSFFADDLPLNRGDKITVSGVISVPENTPSFNTKDYYASRGIFLFINSAEIIDYTPSENPVYTAVSGLHNTVMSTVRRAVPTDEGELIIGMLFGSKYSRLDTKTEQLLNRAGIGHITAVSGMHLSIAAAIALFICTAVGLNKNISALIVCCVSALFVIICDMNISVIRGFIMVVLVYSGQILLRKSDPLSSLAVAAVILTITAPYLIRNTGFLLSLSGVFGTAVLAPDFIKRFESQTFFKDKRLPIAVKSLIACICASISVFPAAVLSFNEVSAIAPLTNLLLSPLVELALTVSLIGLVFSPINGISAVFFLIAGVIIRPVLKLSLWVGQLDFAAIPLKLPMLGILLIISLTAFAAASLLLKSKLYSHIITAACMFVILLYVAVYRIIPTEGITVQILSAGNGCALVCSDGHSAQIIDISGTSSCAKMAGQYLSGIGINRVDAVILTKKTEYTAQLYRSVLYEADSFVTADWEDGDGILFSSESGTEIEVFADESAVEIAVNGARILCINNSEALQTGHYDAVIYNNKKSVDVDSELYIITGSTFSGYLPADSHTEFNCCELCIGDGEIGVR